LAGTTAIASIEDVGMGEALDDGGGDDRRIGSVAPRSLERRIAGTEVLAFDGRAQVAQHLLGDGSG
jgi:hypothetical protein